MVSVSRKELEEKASEIGRKVSARRASGAAKPLEIIKEEVDESAKFALEKALSMKGISETQRSAFIELLKEEKGLVNILLVSDKSKAKAAEMLKPLLGFKAEEFIDSFQKVFIEIQRELHGRKKQGAG